MAANSIDELVLRINCTDGILYCCRAFLLNVSKTLQHLQDDCPTPINNVEVPFTKNIFGALIKFTDYSNPKISSDSEEAIIPALDWLGPTPEIDKLVKERLSPPSKPIILDPELWSSGVIKNSALIFESLAKKGYIVLVERQSLRDFDAIFSNYVVFNEIDHVIEYCLNKYTNSYYFVHPTERNGSLIMYCDTDDDGKLYYLDCYGMGEDDYEYIFKQMKETLKERGFKFNHNRFTR